MEKRRLIYEGKAKILYETDDNDLLIQYFKDDATAFNAMKKGKVAEKGIMNNKISTKIFELLNTRSIPTHYVEQLSDREMLIKKVEIVPLEVIIRNRAAGSFCRNFGVPEGQKLVGGAVLEFSFKCDDLNDPLINDDHVRALNLASEDEVKELKNYTLKINDILIKFFYNLDLELIDFKLEFGRFKGEIILADEISPDTCRFWDLNTGEKLDKDRFRHDLGNIQEAYQEVLNRVSK